MLYILNRDIAVLKESFHVNLWLRQNTFGVTIYIYIYIFCFPLVLRERSDLVILLASLKYPPSLHTSYIQIDTQEGKQEHLWGK